MARHTCPPSRPRTIQLPSALLPCHQNSAIVRLISISIGRPACVPDTSCAPPSPLQRRIFPPSTRMLIPYPPPPPPFPLPHVPIMCRMCRPCASQEIQRSPNRAEDRRIQLSRARLGQPQPQKELQRSPTPSKLTPKGKRKKSKHEGPGSLFGSQGPLLPTNVSWDSLPI